MLTARIDWKNRFQSFSVFSTVPATTKYAKRWIKVTQPSILSKFDQKLFAAFGLKKSEIAIETVKSAKDFIRNELLIL